jgi:hypothetical protein
MIAYGGCVIGYMGNIFAFFSVSGQIFFSGPENGLKEKRSRFSFGPFSDVLIHPPAFF